MDRSSTSSEISFHRLPSKSKRPSIRKQIVIFNSSFYETGICREIFSKHFLAIIFLNFQKIFAAHQKNFPKTFRKFTQKTPMVKSYFSKAAGFHVFTETVTGGVL